MARYQVILTYDGTRFAGSQRQVRTRTVQGEFETALRSIGWSGRSILMAGRTDAGVHASGQVATFDLEWQHGEQALLRALNANLPQDLAVQTLRSVDAEFHPRFDARSRRYRYRLFCRPVRDPLREKFAWRVWPEVSEASLQAVSPLFLGKRDFSAYGSPTRPGGTCVRTVMKSDWRFESGEWFYEVEADAFLYRMVRRLVFIQVAVAQGTLPVENVRQALETPAEDARKSAFPSGIAPASGLTLVQVFY